MAGATDVLPDLLLSGLIGRDRERHELLEGHAVFGIDLVQLRRHRREPQSLLHDRRRHEMPGRNIFFAQASVAQSLESSKLVQRMQADPLVILRERVILGNATLAHDARNGLRLCHALLLHQKFQRTIAPATRRHLEHAGLVALGIDDGSNAQALQQGALRDAFG